MYYFNFREIVLSRLNIRVNLNELEILVYITLNCKTSSKLETKLKGLKLTLSFVTMTSPLDPENPEIQDLLPTSSRGT